MIKRKGLYTRAESNTQGENDKRNIEERKVTR